jgi:hypothetical protein
MPCLLAPDIFFCRLAPAETALALAEREACKPLASSLSGLTDDSDIR